METQRLLALWERALDALEADPSALVGVLDWVTKRALIDGCDDLSPAARKKIDLRYHDIVDGYLVELEAAGVARRSSPPAKWIALARSRPRARPRKRGRV